MVSGPSQVGLVGATGRLGSAVGALLREREIPVVLRANREGWHATGTPSVVIDTSSPDCVERTVALCRESGAALVYAVSHLADASPLTELAEHVPVVRATNLSLGHWLQLRLLAAAATWCAEPPVVSVRERHPAHKTDRPSSSALELARHWAAAAGTEVTEVTAIRAGHAVSDHVVQLDFAGESLVLGHDVRDRVAAARGALTAVEWLRTAPAGLHTMSDVFDDRQLGAGR